MCLIIPDQISCLRHQQRQEQPLEYLSFGHVFFLQHSPKMHFSSYYTIAIIVKFWSAAQPTSCLFVNKFYSPMACMIRHGSSRLMDKRNGSLTSRHFRLKQRLHRSLGCWKLKSRTAGNVRRSATYNRPRLYSCTGIIPGMLAKPGVRASLNVFLVHRVSWETEKVYSWGNGNANVPAMPAIGNVWICPGRVTELAFWGLGQSRGRKKRA